MKISVCCCIIAGVAVMASAHGVSGQTVLDKRISLAISSTTLDRALEQMRTMGEVSLYYDLRIVKSFSVETMRFENEKVASILKGLLKKTNLTYEVNGTGIVIRPQETNRKMHLPKPGIVAGQIIDENSGEPLIGATILVKLSDIGTVTDIEGKYRMSLDPGSYDIEFRFVGYQVKLITGIIISDGQITSLNVAMKPEASSLGEVVITAEYSKASVEGLLVKQKNNLSMTDGMSQEQIRLTPDNNTAQVLRRVSGVTVQNDRFVTIRGLSDRYNNVLINGASAPSTEPNRRNFSFDIVPSALIDNVLVNKTASPDLPGEFTGGIVMVNTKDIPEKNFLNFTYGRGVNSESTGKSMISTQRDKHALLGQIDEEKKWFGDGRLYDQKKYYSFIATNDQHSMDSIGASIPNNWQLYRYPYTPMQNYQLTGGLVKELKRGGTLGFTSALTYRNEQLIESGLLGRMFNSNYQYDSDRYKYNTSTGLLFNSAYKSARHQIAWKNLYNNRYSNQFDDQLGYDIGDTQWQRRISNVTLGSRLIQSRLEGVHSVTPANIKIEWSADITDMMREQPDGRFILSTYNGSGKSDDREEYTRYQFSDTFTKYGGLYAATLNEDKKNAAISVSVPFQVLRGRHLIKAGYALSKRSNDYDGVFLRILGNPPGELGGAPYYQIALPELFASHRIWYRPSFAAGQSTGDRYTGDQDLRAYYALADLTFLKKIRVTGGARYEDNGMKLNTVFYSAATGLGKDSVKHYVDRNWLPSLNIIYSATKKFNVRASYSKTLSRPEFVERSPYIYFDFAENVQVTGQRELDITRITNYDFRLEYYFTPGEIISASVFYKEFEKPVERFFYLENSVNIVEYWNLHSARARGIEFNFIKSLNFTGIPEHWSKNLYLSGNFSLLKGEIFAVITKAKDGRTDTTAYVSRQGRPVQGLSPYTINTGLGYQSERWGINAVYNRFGRRIVNGGSSAHVVQYESPRNVIDLQLNWFMMKRKLVARVNISDLLSQPFVIYTNGDKTKNGNVPNNDPGGESFNPDYDYVTYNVKKGTSYSFSLSYTF